MKFFNPIPISSYPFRYWVFHDGAQDTPAPSHRLYYPYSKHRSLRPKSGAPNTACPAQETPVGEGERYDPLTSLQERLCSKKEGTQGEHGRDPCSQHPLGWEHPLNCKSARLNRDTLTECHPLTHGNGIW